MSTATQGKVRIEIIDRNGVRTSRWVNRQQRLTEAATNKRGMIAQLQTDPSTGRTTITENGKMVGFYESQPRAMPGLINNKAVLRDLEHRQEMELYLARENRWLTVKSDHDRPILDPKRGTYEHWLFGVRASSREEWEAMKRMPPSHVIEASYWKIVKLAERRDERDDLERLADTGLPEN